MVKWRDITMRRVVAVLLLRTVQFAAFLLTLAAVAMVALYSSGSVRSRMSLIALDLAADAIPGELKIGHVDWPELGHLSLQKVTWRDGQSPGATLAEIASLELAWDMDALRQGEIQVDSLVMAAERIDLPELLLFLASLPQDSAASYSAFAVAADTTDSAGLLRAGALPGIPSLSITAWHVSCERLIVTPELILSNMAGKGSLELGNGESAGAQIEHLQLSLSLAFLDSAPRPPIKFDIEHIGLSAQFKARPDDKIALTLDRLQLDFAALQVASVFASDKLPTEMDDELAGRILASGSLDMPLLASRFDLNLERTPWLDRGRLSGRGIVDLVALPDSGLSAVNVKIDSLVLAYLGSEIFARGELARETVNLHLAATIPDSQALMLVWPDSLAPPVVSLDMVTTIAGTPSDFDLDLALAGYVTTDQAHVPAIDLHARGTSDGGQLDLILPEGFEFGGTDLDSLVLNLNFERMSTRKLTGGFSLAARRGEDLLRTGGRVRADSLSRAGLRAVILDSLVFGGHGQSLRLQETSTLLLGPEPGYLSLSPLQISGAPGDVNLGGEISQEEISLQSVVSLFGTEEQLNQWLPSSFWSENGGRDLSLESDLKLRGTIAAPTLVGHLDAKLLPHRDDPTLGMSMEFSMATGDSSGVTARVALTMADSLLLRAELDVPGAIDADDGFWRSTPGQPAVFRIPNQTLHLGHLNRILPADIEMRGRINGGLEVSTPRFRAGADSAIVSGGLSSSGLDIELPNRSRLETSFDLKITGSLMDAQLGGDITIHSAFIRLPDLPRNVHDFEGESALWNLAAADSAVGDSLHIYAPLPVDENLQLGATSAMPLPDLDLAVHLPGNFRINGYGLDVELAGELKVGRGYDEDGFPQPKIDGLLRTLVGTLNFMNRTFEVERGEIIFTESAPPNPRLSLVLTTDVNGTLVRIMITGRANEPVFELSSDPDFEESDIMAILLFGQPMNDLDDDQRGGVRSENDPGQELRQNMAGLALVFGTAGMQNTVTSSVGVDMVEVGSDSDGESTLMVGKFINPRLMVKYHHSLTKSGTFFVTMEYALTRVFRVISTYGQGEEDSGLELTWRRRY